MDKIYDTEHVALILKRIARTGCLNMKRTEGVFAAVYSDDEPALQEQFNELLQTPCHLPPEAVEKAMLCLNTLEELVELLEKWQE